MKARLLAVALAVTGQDALEGRWTAEARLGPESMTLVLDVERRDGELAGRLSVPQERVLGLRLDGFVLAERELGFQLPHPNHPLGFSGTVESERIEGALTSGGRELPVVFRRTGPTPAPPYREIEVSFAGEGRTVRGSLLVPPGEGRRPALALFHSTTGSERDYLRFYADLAARAGLVALIYDRRPVPIDVAVMTRADFLAVVADAESAVRYLRSREEVDQARAGVGGLSQGAWISAIVAARVPEVAFVVALSAPGVPLHEIDFYQSVRRLEAAGVQGAELAEACELLRDLFAASRSEFDDRAALDRRLQEMRRRPWAASLGLPQDVPPSGASGSLLRWTAHDLDPALFFERLRVPVFLAFGDRDERLPAEASATRIAARLERVENRAVTLHRYVGANHALLPAPEFEADLTRWLRERAAP